MEWLDIIRELIAVRFWWSLDPDLEFFSKKIYDCGVGSGNSQKIHSLADIRLNRLKAALAEVCTLRVLLF